ncbi:MAG: hypothetical protein IKL78_01200 [Lachnospiraceae bacterium]|nr:hypothetical protein [Lachnospiraceae bacterium]
MRELLVVREHIKHFYAKFEVYVTPLLKFILAFVALVMIKNNVGYFPRLNSMAIVLIIALMCSFLPQNFIVFFSAAFSVLHLYKLSYEVAIVAVCVYLLLFLLYLRFSPRDTIVVVLTPVCFALNIPYLMPLVAGLVGTPTSIVSVCCGAIVYYLLSFISGNAGSMLALGEDGSLAKLRYVIDGMLDHKEMLTMLLAISVTVIVVYLIRRLSIDYAWSFAIGIGALMNIVLLLLGDVVYYTNVSIFGVFFGSIVAVLLAMVLQFFVFDVDYSRTEKVQFEDDDYYYYVKAVPKNKAGDIGKKAKKAVVKPKIDDDEDEDEDDEDDDVRIVRRTQTATRMQTTPRTTQGSVRPVAGSTRTPVSRPQSTANRQTVRPTTATNATRQGSSSNTTTPQ